MLPGAATKSVTQHRCAAKQPAAKKATRLGEAWGRDATPSRSLKATVVVGRPGEPKGKVKWGEETPE